MIASKIQAKDGFDGNQLNDLDSSVHVRGAADDPDGDCRGCCGLGV